MTTVSLDRCTYRKETKSLLVASEFFSGAFPATVSVRSHKTGTVYEFKQVPYGHPLSDPDCWDGEMSVYIPVDNNCPIAHLTVYHEY